MGQSWRESGPLPPEGGVPSRVGTPPSGGSGIKPAVTEALRHEQELSFREMFFHYILIGLNLKIHLICENVNKKYEYCYLACQGFSLPHN